MTFVGFLQGFNERKAKVKDFVIHFEQILILLDVSQPICINQLFLVATCSSEQICCWKRFVEEVHKQISFEPIP